MTDHTPEAQTRITVEDSISMAEGTEAALDDVFAVLADEQRRQVLAVVRESSVAMDVSTLAERVAAGLTTRGSAPVTDATVRRLRNSLYHKHLPMIASAGLIEYDTESQTVKAIDPVNS